jgi:hypothetical protein
LYKQDNPGQIAENFAINHRSNTTANLVLRHPTNSNFSSENLDSLESTALSLYIISSQDSKTKELFMPLLLSTIQCNASDNTDLYGDNVIQSCTSPNFYPGRVIIIGSALHKMATSAHSQNGISISACDAVVLSSLIEKYFKQDLSPEKILETISVEFTNSRVDANNKAMEYAHYEAIFYQEAQTFWNKVVKKTVGHLLFKQSLDDISLRGKMNL